MTERTEGREPQASKYVVGLLFSPGRDRVALIEKDHPAWQAGKLNGIGGKVEKGESVWQAVSREVNEEAGVVIPPEDWEAFLILEGEEYSATFLRTFSPKVLDVRTMTSERVTVVSPTMDPLNQPTIPNLRWIVPLAMDRNLAVPIRIYDRNIAGPTLTGGPDGRD